MKQEGLLYFSDTSLIVVAFFLFFISFLVLSYQVYTKKNKSYYEQMAKLPFQEEKRYER